MEEEKDDKEIKETWERRGVKGEEKATAGMEREGLK